MARVLWNLIAWSHPVAMDIPNGYIQPSEPTKIYHGYIMDMEWIYHGYARDIYWIYIYIYNGFISTGYFMAISWIYTANPIFNNFNSRPKRQSPPAPGHAPSPLSRRPSVNPSVASHRGSTARRAGCAPSAAWDASRTEELTEERFSQKGGLYRGYIYIYM